MKSLQLILLLVSFYSHAQQTLSGRVIDGVTKLPLDGARAFVSNTTYQTITNANGNFYLLIPEGNFNVGISFMGYEAKIVTSALMPDRKTIYTIELYPQIESLDTVTILTSAQREKFRELFKDLFLGATPNAKKCKILNIEDVNFNVDSETGLWEATCDVPLIIENPDLNYKITFLLSYLKYSRTERISSYLGYSSFEDLYKLSGKALDRIIENREIAYHGSSTHFLRALYLNKTKDEGFSILGFNQRLNPNYPSDEIRSQLLSEAQKTKNYTKLIALQPKFLYEWDTVPSTANNILVENQGQKLLQFKNYLNIKYYREKPHRSYHGIIAGQKSSDFQVSQLYNQSDLVELFANGSTSNPDALIFYGYMGWEKVADMVPFDFEIQFK